MAQQMTCDGGCGQVATTLVTDITTGDVMAFEPLDLAVWAIMTARTIQEAAKHEGIDWPGLTDQIIDATGPVVDDGQAPEPPDAPAPGEPDDQDQTPGDTQEVATDGRIRGDDHGPAGVHSPGAGQPRPRGERKPRARQGAGTGTGDR